MGGPVAQVPCVLNDQGGGFYTAVPGQMKLALQNQLGGTTSFICGTCVVWDYTTTAHPVVSAGVTCSATSFEFNIPPLPAGASKSYRIQLTFAQVPAYGATADLVEAACGQVLLSLNAGRLALQWQLTVTG